ncbi:MAG: hypothetical protein H6R15_3205 [Proteobacteria bacterium]|nr:hypothetical protein [Pseudomonadota bacterium]
MQTKPNTRLTIATLIGILAQSTALAEAPASPLLQRGAHLVAYGGCVDCHTPFKMGPNGPEKDHTRGLSGHPEELRLATPPKLDGDWNWAGSASMTAFVGPWGMTYAANLTPDRETGIGAWSVRDFMQAMRTGKHLGVARPILPPMPWQALAGLPERDLRAIYAYLMAQPAVKNRVPDYAPAAGTTTTAGTARPPA